MEAGGATLFPSNFPGNEGITSVETIGFEGDTFARLLHFGFDLTGTGVVLEPGFSYVFFAVLSPEGLLGTDRVPGEGADPAGLEPEASIFISSYVDAPPYQLHQPFPQELNDFDSGVLIQQLTTSRLIPVIPEPSSLLLVAMGIFCSLRRRA